MRTKLKYSVCGTGKNIVLIHGWGMHSGIWLTIANQLSKTHRVTLFDLPGYGDNNMLTENHTLPGICEKILSIIQRQSVVIGWSMGGLVAMWLAINSPQLVNKLILTNSTPCFIEKKDWPGIKIDTLNQFKNGLNENLQRTLLRFTVLQIDTKNFTDSRKHLHLLKEIILLKAQSRVEILIAGLNILLHTDLRSQATSIKSLTLYILGEYDRLVPASLKQHLNILIPQSQVGILHNASHVPFVSHAHSFLKIVTDFIYAK